MSCAHVLNKAGLGVRSPLDHNESLPAYTADQPRPSVIRKMFAFNYELLPNTR